MLSKEPNSICEGACPGGFYEEGEALRYFVIPGRHPLSSLWERVTSSDEAMQERAMLFLAMEIISAAIHRWISKKTEALAKRCMAEGSNGMECQPTAVCECVGRLRAKWEVFFDDANLNAGSSMFPSEDGLPPDFTSVPDNHPTNKDRLKAAWMQSVANRAMASGKADTVQELETLEDFHYKGMFKGGEKFFVLIRWTVRCVCTCELKEGARAR